MFRKDYLKKQIDQAGKMLEKVLEKLLGITGQEEIREALESTAREMKAVLTLDSEEIAALPDSEFIAILSEKTQLDPEYFDKLAEVLYQSAELLEREEQSEKALQFYRKALLLYKEADRQGQTFFFERYLKIEKINALPGI